ncbi:TPA: hypothetical protein SIA26_001668 [Aeromonas bestiarum]|nr:hypothetical protein [Aeromonas bestiarum]
MHEKKEVIWIVKAVFAVTDEDDEGAGPLIDMTKVTRSTLADKPPATKEHQETDGTTREDSGAVTRLVLPSRQPISIKPNRTREWLILINLLSQSRFSAPAPSVFKQSGYYVPLGNQLRWGRFHADKQYDTTGKNQQTRG